MRQGCEVARKVSGRVVRPAKAGAFGGKLRGRPTRVKARSPVARMAGRSESERLKPIDTPIVRMGASHQAVTKVNVEVASKVRDPGGRARDRDGEGSTRRRNLADTTLSSGGVEATA